MMSPRSSGRYGNSFSYQAPRPPKMNLFTSKWSPMSSVPSIDAEGILNACTMKVVPKRARITVTRSDSMYSEKVASSPRRSGFASRSSGTVCWVIVSSDMGVNFAPRFAPIALAPRLQRAAQLPSLYFLGLKPCWNRRPRLLLQRSSDDRARARRQVDIRREPSRGPAKIPAKPICGRSQIAPCRAPPMQIQREWFAAFPWRPKAPRPDRSPPLRLRTRRPAEQACHGHRSSPRRGQGEDVLREGAAEQPTPELAHSPAAPGSSKAVPRSTWETSPQDTRWPTGPERHRPRIPTVHCSRSTKHRQNPK